MAMPHAFLQCCVSGQTPTPLNVKNEALTALYEEEDSARLADSLSEAMFLAPERRSANPTLLYFTLQYSTTAPLPDEQECDFESWARCHGKAFLRASPIGLA